MLSLKQWLYYFLSGNDYKLHQRLATSKNPPCFPSLLLSKELFVVPKMEKHCPDCLVLVDYAELKRWPSTQTPRLECLCASFADIVSFAKNERLVKRF